MWWCTPMLLTVWGQVWWCTPMLLAVWGQVWWCTHLIQALRKQRQVISDFQSSPFYSSFQASHGWGFREMYYLFVGLKLLVILLLQPPECCDYRHEQCQTLLFTKTWICFCFISMSVLPAGMPVYHMCAMPLECRKGQKIHWNWS